MLLVMLLLACTRGPSCLFEPHPVPQCEGPSSVQAVLGMEQLWQCDAPIPPGYTEVTALRWETAW